MLIMENIDSYKKRFGTLMESTLGDAKPLVSEQHIDGEMEEGGGTWEGIKGFFRGKGYYYTKYLTQIQYVLEKLQKKIGSDKKIKADLDEILEDITESSMEESKKDELLDLMLRINQGIEEATQLLEMQIQQIKDLKK